MSLRGMLRYEEGVRSRAYPDPLTGGKPWTIGVGHTGPEVHEGLVWNDEQIESAYVKDAALATALCIRHFPWFFELNEARQAVLVGMMFQMGPSRLLKFINTLAAMKQCRYADAARGMTDSLWARQTPKRVVRVAEQMATGIWNPKYLE
jgi:lysozyme